MKLKIIQNSFINFAYQSEKEKETYFYDLVKAVAKILVETAICFTVHLIKYTEMYI